MSWRKSAIYEVNDWALNFFSLSFIAGVISNMKRIFLVLLLDRPTTYISTKLGQIFSRSNVLLRPLRIIPPKKFLTHKSLFHKNHHIFLAQSFYPSCHYSTNTIKVQAKMELQRTVCTSLTRKKSSTLSFFIQYFANFYVQNLTFLDAFSIIEG